MRRAWLRIAWLALAAAPGVGAAQCGDWETLRPLPAAQQEVGVAAADGLVYVIGGFDGAGGTVNTVRRYDPATDEWETLAPLPAALNHVGAASVDGVVYAVGGLTAGFQGVDNVYAFDPATGMWSGRAPLPTARGASGVAVIGGLIYVAGGLPRRNDFAVYDPGTDEWTELPPMPTARDHLAAAAVDGVFYAISGRAAALQGAVEAFDPGLGRWEARAPIPTARGGIAAGAVDGVIYVFGGEGNPADPRGIFHEVEAYDPRVDMWTSLEPMPVGRHGIGAAVVDGRISLPGGADAAGFGAVVHHDVFTPCPPDLNCDGALDFFDFLEFQSRFAASDPRADCDRSGSLDFFDFLCFQSAFAAGCP